MEKWYQGKRFAIFKQCTSKTKFNEVTARETIKRLEKKENKKLYSYECTICNYIHITSKKKQ